MKKIILITILVGITMLNFTFSDTTENNLKENIKIFSLEKSLLENVSKLYFFNMDNFEGKRIPVLMYHHISEDVSNISIVTKQKFAEDMKKLKDNSYTSITLEELYNALNSKKILPENPVIITVDDGYKSNYKHIYTILKELDMKASINVIGGLIGKDKIERNNRKIKEHFSLEEMKEMSNSGVIDIQNHTYDLHSANGRATYSGDKVNLGVLPFEKENFNEYSLRLSKDLLKTQNIIKETLNDEAEFIVYPYGESTLETHKVIKKLGFKGSLSIKPGIKSYKNLEDLYNIPRINISNETDVIEEIKKY